MINVYDFSPLIEEAFSKNKEFIMPVKGTSMLPFIKEEDKVVINKPTSLKKDDIILYRRNEKTFVLHRIYKIKNNCFYMLGDNQFKVEYPIYENQILAKVTYIIKNEKRKPLKGIKYKMYLLINRNLFIRRVFIHIRRKKYEKK